MTAQMNSLYVMPVRLLSRRMYSYCFYDAEDMIELAKGYCKIFPSAERVRIVNTGTEATMAALRLSYGFRRIRYRKIP